MTTLLSTAATTTTTTTDTASASAAALTAREQLSTPVRRLPPRRELVPLLPGRAGGLGRQEVHRAGGRPR